MKSEVDILLPSYNPMPFLSERLRSIQFQSYPHWKLTVLDSHSNDGSREIYDDITDERIQVNYGPREGIYPAWNSLLTSTKNDWIYIATADDTMYPNCLSRCMESVSCHPETRVVMFGIDTIDQDSNFLEHWHSSWKHRPRYVYGDRLKKETIIPGKQEFVAQLLASGVYQSITGMLFHREVFEQIGFFPTDLDSAGDSSWIIQMAARFDILWIPENLATWRLHGNQGSRNKKKPIHRGDAVDQAMQKVRELDHFSEDFLQGCEDIRKKALLLPNPRGWLGDFKNNGIHSVIREYGVGGSVHNLMAMLTKVFGYSLTYRERARIIHELWARY